MDRTALAIAQHLDFDVAWLFEIAFEIDITIAERRLGLGLGGLDGILEFGLGARHLHAAPTAARRRLDQHRIADVLGDVPGLADVADAAFRARYDRNAELLGGPLGFD